MPIYFFHVLNDVETRDEEEQELVDAAAARASAVRDCRALAAQFIVEHHHLIMHHRIEIVDAADRHLDTVRFGDVMTVRP